jgi:hypothetical protein
MRTRSKALVGTLSGLALLALSAMPASANTVSVELDSGSIEVRDFTTDDLIATIPLGDSGEGDSCGGGSTATANSSGTTVGMTIDTQAELIDPFGDSVDYYVDLNATFTGTYTVNAGNDSINISGGTATADIYELAGSCTPGDAICTVDASNFTGSGTTNASMPTFATNNTASVNIANPGFFDTAAAGCDSGFSQLDLAKLVVSANLVVL